MLPREFRLGSAAEFAAVIKAGRRAGTRTLVVHVSVGGRSDSPHAGFVVSGKVGNSVIRHRVTRRLRPLVRQELRGLAPGTEIVVRALPLAAVATSADLGADLRSGLTSALRKARASAPRATSDVRSVDASPGSGSRVTSTPGPIAALSSTTAAGVSTAMKGASA